MPLIIGCCMAFILNVLMKFIENRAFGKIKDRRVWRALKRPVSLLLTLIIVLGILTFVSAMIIPTLRDTVATLITKTPGYLTSLGQWASEYLSRFGLDDVIDDMFNFSMDGSELIERIWSFLTGAGSLVAKNAAGVVVGVFSGMTNFILGLIFAIYILLTKERLGAQLTRLISIYLPKQHGARILDVATLSRSVFEKFVAGQCLEAIIIGTLSGIGSIAINPSFALMLGVLIGFSVLIPVVGSIVGVLIGAFLLLMESPWQALAFIVFIIILQQLDNNLIYPRVVGKSIGLPGMWVLLAVLVGGSINGIMGILIGVPLSSVLYSLLCRDVRARETATGLTQTKELNGEAE
jgi:predicted PurR-regulated permease PerM